MKGKWIVKLLVIENAKVVYILNKYWLIYKSRIIIGG